MLPHVDPAGDGPDGQEGDADDQIDQFQAHGLDPRMRVRALM